MESDAFNLVNDIRNMAKLPLRFLLLHISRDNNLVVKEAFSSNDPSCVHTSSPLKRGARLLMETTLV